MKKIFFVVKKNIFCREEKYFSSWKEIHINNENAMVNTYSNLQNSNFYNIFYYLLLRKKGF